MILEGKILGNRYEIIEKVGNGGMATVYRAEDKVLKRNVAVKVLKDEFTTDEEFIKRFEIEAQSAARLTHPNIVSIYDVGSEDNLYYIVMELIRGKTLKEIIVEERGPLPWKWSVNVAIQIASALEMAHKNNIIHYNRGWNSKSYRFWNCKSCFKFNDYSFWNNYRLCTLFFTRTCKRWIYRCQIRFILFRSCHV